MRMGDLAELSIKGEEKLMGGRDGRKFLESNRLVEHNETSNKYDRYGIAERPLQFGLDNNSSHPNGKDSSKFVENLGKRLNVAYDLATKNAQVASKRNKVRYDAKRREAKLLPGDRVFVRNSTPSGKLDNKWEKEVYVVDKKPNELQDIPVYIIRREDGVGRKRTLYIGFYCFHVRYRYMKWSKNRQVNARVKSLPSDLLDL
ncbi:hypothetical protein QZH41_001318 [Actinostola sp. cb2023]|nr:hypothetical protein QZH41_001318 [Actinostola sp. cb2023]